MKYQVGCLASDQSWIWEEFRYEWAKIVTKTSLNTLGFDLPGRFNLLSTISWQFWNPWKVWAASNWNTFSPRLLCFFSTPTISLSILSNYFELGAQVAQPGLVPLISYIYLPSAGIAPMTPDQTFLYNMHKTPPNVVFNPWWLGFIPGIFWCRVGYIT